MTASDPKADLHRYLQDAREALLWKLDGLSEYDIRRPLVPTGTNLLGLVKHVASVEFGYFGDCFGRPFDEPMPWLEDDAEPNADMWATADAFHITQPHETGRGAMQAMRDTLANADAAASDHKAATIRSPLIRMSTS